MVNVLLVSHGFLAKEMYATAKMIFGEVQNMSYLELPAGCDLGEYKNSIIQKVEESSDGLLILADLFGGSPFMLSTQVFGEEQYNKKMELITGMNLSMVLEVASQIPYASLQELKQIALNAGAQGVSDLRERLG